MEQHQPHQETGGRQLVRRLRALGQVEAPPSTLWSILAGVGLGDSYWRLETHIGPVFVAYNAKGISAVMQASDDADFERAFRARFGRPAHALGRPPDALAHAVTEHLPGGKRRQLSFDLRGLTAFQRAVLLKALEIPSGEVRPYSWVAREIGYPRAVRAVGSALGANPIPLLIPCHRVVRSDGRVGQYGLGTDAKRAMLAAEGVDPRALEELARAGVRYFGSDTTRVYCFPTCRNARRISERHRLAFRSSDEAAAAQYRPCRMCRPAVAS